MTTYTTPYDNLFNATHRDIMREKHGATEAEWVTVGELIEYAKLYAV